ncbi:uncharacterized protein PSFLO_07272 [Pseudozyma flocculosa]|uniref:Uncharacterized protein n=1 Tax=Pseudozyma flocculosa TaxID=84751 RepID=A0A5C3FBZ1_9BASI|nr:uncharacterized protein PSFLO_07272 [Pseudozyma flocculosa]
MITGAPHGEASSVPVTKAAKRQGRLTWTDGSRSTVVRNQAGGRARERASRESFGESPLAMPSSILTPSLECEGQDGLGRLNFQPCIGHGPHLAGLADESVDGSIEAAKLPRYGIGRCVSQLRSMQDAAIVAGQQRGAGGRGACRAGTRLAVSHQGFCHTASKRHGRAGTRHKVHRDGLASPLLADLVRALPPSVGTRS